MVAVYIAGHATVYLPIYLACYRAGNSFDVRKPPSFLPTDHEDWEQEWLKASVKGSGEPTWPFGTIFDPVLSPATVPAVTGALSIAAADPLRLWRLRKGTATLHRNCQPDVQAVYALTRQPHLWYVGPPREQCCRILCSPPGTTGYELAWLLRQSDQFKSNSDVSLLPVHTPGEEVSALLGLERGVGNIGALTPKLGHALMARCRTCNPARSGYVLERIKADDDVCFTALMVPEKLVEAVAPLIQGLKDVAILCETDVDQFRQLADRCFEDKRIHRIARPALPKHARNRTCYDTHYNEICAELKTVLTFDPRSFDANETWVDSRRSIRLSFEELPETKLQ